MKSIPWPVYERTIANGKARNPLREFQCFVTNADHSLTQPLLVVSNEQLEAEMTVEPVNIRMDKRGTVKNCDVMREPYTLTIL